MGIWRGPWFAVGAAIALLGGLLWLFAGREATGWSSVAGDNEGGGASIETRGCANDNGGITLPPALCATVFADNIGHARHVVVAPNGVVYVNTWSGRYYGNDTPLAGGFLVGLQDTNGDGRADANVRFGETREQGSAGGTGIALYIFWIT